MARTDACHIASCGLQSAYLCCHLHEATTRPQTRNDHEGVPNAIPLHHGNPHKWCNTYYLGYCFYTVIIWAKFVLFKFEESR